MFLKDLTEAEKKAFVCLAVLIVNADGVVSTGEVAFMENLAQELNIELDHAKISEKEAFDILAAANAKVKRAFYVELLSLTIADGSQDPKEKACMKEIQGKAGLADSYVKEAEDWLSEYLGVAQKGYKLIEG
jgi:tellurite resistance protein